MLFVRSTFLFLVWRTLSPDCGHAKGFSLPRAATSSTTSATTASTTFTQWEAFSRILLLKSSFQDTDADADTRSVKTQDLVYADHFLLRKVAKDAEDTLTIPLVPKAITRHYVEQSLATFALQPETWTRFHELIYGRTTKSNADNLSKDEIIELANDVARELHADGFLKFPLIRNKELELQIMTFLSQRLLFHIGTSPSFRRRTQQRKQVETVKALLSKEERDEKVEALSRQIRDRVPWMSNTNGGSETSSLQIVEDGLEAVASVLESLIPEPVVKSLRGEDEGSLGEVKEHIVRSIQNNTRFFGLSAEQEEELIRTVVDIAIENTVDDLDPIFYILSHDEQVQALEGKRQETILELELAETRYQREKVNLKNRLDRLTRKRNRIAGENDVS